MTKRPRIVSIAVRAACATLAGASLSGVAGPVAAESFSGVCPDGSVFIVQSRGSAPCIGARYVDDPSNLPPIRPELLGHPYTWQVDQEARNPNNPYNLLEAAEKIRRARVEQSRTEADAAQRQVSAPETQVRVPADERPNGGVPTLALSEDELRDLVRLVVLRQQQAPAEIVVEDIKGSLSLRIQLSHSSSFEELVLGALGRRVDEKRIVVFTASAPVETEFHPSFFVTQSGKTFRPDPRSSAEVAYLVGEPGPIPAGALALGYFAIPSHFDITQPMAIWWNDRSVDVTLVP